MNIAVEPKEPLVDLLTLTVGPEDYQQEYESTLKQYTRTMQLPGFRQGKVPASLIQKRFGPSLLADQLNTIVGKGLNEFLKGETVPYLARPYLLESNLGSLNPTSNQAFEFKFELGREPEFALNLQGLGSYPYYEVKVSDAEVETAITRYRYQAGNNVAAEEVIPGKDYLVVGILKEAEPPASDEVQPFVRFFNVYTALQAKLTPLLLNKKVGDGLPLVPSQVLGTVEEGAAQLRISTAEYEAIAAKPLNFEVRQIFENTPAALDAAFFGKVLQGAAEGLNETEFYQRMKEKMEADAKATSEAFLQDKIRRDLLNGHSFELPDRILQRWLVEEFEEFKKPGELEKRYPSYRQELRFHLIRKKLEERFPEMVVESQDVRSELQERFKAILTRPVVESPEELAAQAVLHEHGEEQSTEAAPELHVHAALSPTEAVLQAQQDERVHLHDDHHHHHDEPHGHSHSHDHSHEHEHASPEAAQEQLLNSLLDNFMGNEQYYQSEYSKLRNQRLFEVLQSQVVQVKPTPVSFTQFEQVLAAGE